MSYHGSDIDEYEYTDWELSDILREEEIWAPIDEERNYYISNHHQSEVQIASRMED